MNFSLTAVIQPFWKLSHCNNLHKRGLPFKDRVSSFDCELPQIHTVLCGSLVLLNRVRTRFCKGKVWLQVARDIFEGRKGHVRQSGERMRAFPGSIQGRVIGALAVIESRWHKILALAWNNCRSGLFKYLIERLTEIQRVNKGSKKTIWRFSR